MTSNEIVTAPAVVVGGGIAGLSTALSLDGCVLVTNGAIGEGSSQLAQGGIAAAIGCDDSPALHAADTLRVGAGLSDAAVAALVAQAASGRVDWLDKLGVAFDRDPGGRLTLNPLAPDPVTDPEDRVLVLRATSGDAAALASALAPFGSRREQLPG